MNFRLNILLFLLIFSCSLKAQIAPKYSNEFMGIGVGARALGMGNSVIASSDDINATYWNPAGLYKLDKK